MSTSAAKRIASDSPEFGDSLKPRQTSRSVSLLTPEQLQRKRAQDRESQRQTRARVKQTIAELEKRVEVLTQELHLTKLENASLQEKTQLAPPGTIPTTVPPPFPILSPDAFPEGGATMVDAAVRQKSHTPYVGMNSGFSSSMVVVKQISPEPPGQTILDPSLFYLHDDFEQQSMSIPVWDARPLHYPATCRFDKVCLDLVESLRPLNPIGGNALEFSSPKFPDVAALLNPQHHSSTFPLTAAIASHIIYVLAKESLPEQIGILYNMCCMMRWVITGSEEDYFAMPDWLRPGAAQIVTAHPVWVDMVPWPKARDKLCRDVRYHERLEAFKRDYNESISVNWPYEPTDTLIRISPTEIAVNPVFISHIRANSNWTVDPSFLHKYPDFEGDVNVGKPRRVVSGR